MDESFSHLVHLDPEMHHWINKYAIVKDMTREEVINRLIQMGRYALEEEEKQLNKESLGDTELHPRLQLSVLASIESLLILQKAHLKNNAEIEEIRKKAKSLIQASLKAFANKQVEDKEIIDA